MAGDPRALFVGHDASRTGAPTVLRSFLRWLGATTAADATLVLQRGGPLVADYRAVVPTTVLDHSARHRIGQVVAGWRTVQPGSAGWIDGAVASRHLRRSTADVIVVNTLAALEPTVTAAPSRTPIVCHVHELDGVAARVLPTATAERDRLLAAVERFIAAGPAVAAMLVDRFAIPAARVVVVDEFIDEPPVRSAGSGAVRAELGVGDDAFLVVAAGMAGSRKGTDYFVDLAGLVVGQVPTAVFVWAGGDPDSGPWAEAIHDIAAGDLDTRFHLMATSPDVGPLLGAADVFVSTAREDPFPLAVLEAGAAGTATVAFDSGGVTAMAAGAGFDDAVVPLGDVFALADRIIALGADLDLRREAGEQAAAWVRATHLTEHLAPVLWQAITEVA